MKKQIHIIVGALILTLGIVLFELFKIFSTIA